MKPDPIERVFGRSRLRMVTGDHVEVFREAIGPGERRRYTKRFLETGDADFRQWTEREWRILARLIGHGIRCVPDVVQFDGGAHGGMRQVQTYDAGVTVDQWATLLPVAREGVVRRHVFEDCAHWWALAHHCLAALDEIHALQLVHLDIKADNICIPYGPAEFDPEAAGGFIHAMFDRLALIDFAFSLVSREKLATALPIGWQKDYDYQSPRLLRALEAGRAGDLRPTQELDWRCDLYSLAAMLRRYLPDDEWARGDGMQAGWSARRYEDARALVYRLRDCHDRDFTQWRPHQELIETTGARVAEADLAESLQRGWTLVRDAGAIVVPELATPMTRIAARRRADAAAGAAPAEVAAPATVIETPIAPPAVTRRPRVSVYLSPLAPSAPSTRVAGRRASRRVAYAALLAAVAAVAAPSFVGDPQHPLGDKAREVMADVLARFDAGRASAGDELSAAVQPQSSATVAMQDQPSVLDGSSERAPASSSLQGSGRGADEQPEPSRQGTQSAQPEENTGAVQATEAAQEAQPAQDVQPTQASGVQPAQVQSAQVQPAQVQPAQAQQVQPAPATQPSSPAAPAQQLAQGAQPARGLRRDAHGTSKHGQSGSRSASTIARGPASAPSTSRRWQAPSVAQGARGRSEVASAASSTRRAAPAGSAPSRPIAPASEMAAGRPGAPMGSASAPAAGAPTSAAAAPASSHDAPTPVPMPLVPTPTAPATTAPATIAAATTVPTQPAPTANAAVPVDRPAKAAAAPERTRTIARREAWQDGLHDLLQVLGVISHRSAPVEERIASAPAQSRTPARVAPTEAPAIDRRSEIGASEPRIETARIAPTPPPAQMQESRPSAPIVVSSRAADIAAVAEAPRAGLSPAGYDERGTDARRIVADALPRVAAQAQADAAHVMWMASMAEYPAQDRAVVEAMHVPWRSEQAYLPVVSSVTRSRRLYDDARQAMASGHDADAVEIGWRAFASNPRDPDIAGWLAYAQLRAHPAQAETARQLALHALAFSGSRRSARVDHWTTLAAANALTGRDVDATRALLVALAVTNNVEYACRAALGAYSSFGEALRAPVTAMLRRIRAQGRDDDAPSCVWPSYRVARRMN